MADRITPRLLGFSFYWAWTLLCFQSTVAFLPWPGLDLVLASHTSFFTVSLVSTVFAHPLWGWVVHRFPAARTRTPWIAAGLMSASILCAGWLTAHGPAAMAACGVVSGVASALIDVRWAQVFGEQRPDVSGKCITLSIVLGIAGYFLLSILGRISPIACIVAIAALPLACAASLGRAARAGEGLDAAGQTVPPAHNARQIAGILWRPVVGSLVFFFMYGCIESIVATRIDFNEAHAWALAIELVCVLALFAYLLRRTRVSIGGVYGVALMLVAAGFMVLPLAMPLLNASNGQSGPIFAATVLVSAGTSLFDALLYCMIAHAAFDYRTQGGIVCGVVRGITVGASAVGHIAGNQLGESLWSGALDVVLFVLAATYLLIVSASFFLARRRVMAFAGDSTEGMQVAEVLAPNPASAGVRHTVGAANGSDPVARDWRTVVLPGDGAPAVRIAESGPADADGGEAVVEGASDAAQLESLLDKRIDEVAFAKHLSRRETDVFALIARGRSMPYIAETLVLSENTVRSHTRRIYGKLGVHSKQELLDLVEHGADGAEAGEA